MPAAILPPLADSLRAALREHYFNWDDPAYFGSDAFAFDLEQHVRVRYEECARHIAPWVDRLMPLEGRRVIEIGCGTGSSTAAFAQAVGQHGSIDAYDINAPSINAAKARMELFGLRNTTFHLITGEALTSAMRANNPQQVDIILCYAVLEHQLIQERLDTLATAWDLLRPGGLLVVGDSPNRLTWMDHHTSLLPYFSMLPDELAVQYAHKSPRADFAAQFPAGHGSRTPRATPTQAEITKLARCGRGVSYHEFELALGDLAPLVVGDSFDPEILLAPHRHISLEDKLLFAFAPWHSPNVPPAFLRTAIEVILQKPGGTNPLPPLNRPIPGVRVE